MLTFWMLSLLVASTAIVTAGLLGLWASAEAKDIIHSCRYE